MPPFPPAGTAPNPLGGWEAGFQHETSGAAVAPAPAGFNLQDWDTLPPSPPTPSVRFNARHACLITDGPHRGEVLVWDGNIGHVRPFQPYAIINPYWPAPNPFAVAGPFPNAGYRFYNGLIDMRLFNANGTVVTDVNGYVQVRGELFCAGKAWLPNGRLLVAGGTLRYPEGGEGFVGTKDIWQFDPLAFTALHPYGNWVRYLQQLEAPRWYPTVLIGGEQVFPGFDYTTYIAGGIAPDNAVAANRQMDSYEVARVSLVGLSPFISSFDQRQQGNNWGPANFPRLFGGPISFPNPSPGGTGFFFGRMAAYPRLHVLSTGELFLSGEETRSAAWTHSAFLAGNNFNPGPGGISPYDLTRGQVTAGYPDQIDEGVTIPAPNLNGVGDRYYRIGGARVQPEEDLLYPDKVYPSNWMETCVATTPGNWSNGPAAPPYKQYRMNHARAKPNVTLLPDSRMLAVGGVSAWEYDSNGDIDIQQFNLLPEMLLGVQWTDMAAAGSPRDYHSCSLLLPDGRVFTCGGEHRTLDYQIYNPPYLFGYAADERPLLSAVYDPAGLILPQDYSFPLTYGTTNNRVEWSNALAVGIGVDKVVLMRPAALTHHDDGGQRYFELPSRPAAPLPGRFFDAPRLGANGHPEVPPGRWMLFGITNQGVPSQAYWVNIQ